MIRSKFDFADDSSTTKFPVNKNEELIFFKSVDEATKEWLNALEHIWKLWKKCEVVSQTLTDFFESAPNPYLSVLRILVNLSEFKNIKTTCSLAFTVIEEYTKWLEHKKEAYTHLLVTDLKLAAFKLIIEQNNIEFVKSVAVCYELQKDKEEFIRIIEEVLQQKQYKEAAYYASMLQLQEHFSDPEELIIPLILQTKLTVVEEFLANCPVLQKAVVLYLDDLIVSNEKIDQTLGNLIQENRIPDVKMLTKAKPMSKLIARFVKMYNLPPECCPNLNKKRCEGALQFLVQKRYMDGSLSTDSWREMAQEAVGSDPQLQLSMLRLLVNVKDATEGLYWAKKFKIPKEQWPWAISYELERLESNEASTSATSEVTDTRENYHELKLSRDSIKVIHDSNSFEDFLDKGLKGVSIVGIDSEWKPCFGTKQTELALIQIATKTNVYILDVFSMGTKLGDLWSELALTLFENKSIIKLGFGITHDMTVIRNSHPVLSKLKTQKQGYLDIVHLWKKLVDDYKYRFVFPHESDDFAKNSLSKLVELCLGQKLDKSDQFSNWEQRPLRESQIIYAALDAYCLLEIYDTLEHQCQQLNIPFFDICMELQNIAQQSAPKKNIKRLPTPPQKEHLPRSDSLNRIPRNDSFNFNKEQNFQQYYVPPQQQENNFRRGRGRSSRGNAVPRFNKSHVQQSFPQKSMQQPNKQNMQELSPNYNTQKRSFSPNFNMQEHSVNVSQIKHQQRIPAHSWRVVCDSMLSGLTRKLRMCGCDCVHLEFDRGGEQSVKLAMRENRVFLTRNRGYLKFLHYLQPENCYLVMANELDAQLREVIAYFGIVVSQRDIFSRCESCNSDEFAKVPKSIMDKLVQSSVNLIRENNYNVPSNSSNETLMDTYNDCSGYDSPVTNNVVHEDRTWILSTNSININACETKYHAKVQVDKVPINVLKKVQHFYICDQCGKVYWSGSNLERTLHGVIKDLIVPV